MVFALAIENGFTSLVILAIVTSLIGVYFYFRVIIAMFFKEPVNEEIPDDPSLTSLLYVLIGVTIALGIFPDSLLQLMK